MLRNLRNRLNHLETMLRSQTVLPQDREGLEVLRIQVVEMITRAEQFERELKSSNQR
jgi:hypothetical protein